MGIEGAESLREEALAKEREEREVKGGDERKPGGAGAGDAGADGASKPPDLEARFEELKKENASLRETAAKAVKDAEGAKAYVQTLVQRIEEAANRPNPPPGPAAGIDPNDPDARAAIRERLESDPIGFMNAHFQERIRPLANFALDNQAALNRQLAADRLKDEDWADYADEVDEFMQGMPPEVRAKPGSYEAAFRFVLSKPENFEKVVAKRMNRKLEQEKGAFVERPSGGANRTPSKPVLSDVEKTIAKGMGISEEDWIANMG